MKKIELTEWYDARIDVVWKALTDKDEMKKWYFDLEEFIPEVGFEFQFEGTGHTGEKYMHLCKIIEVVEGKRLSYSWKYDRFEGDSLVAFDLTEEGGKTKLVLTHSGVSTFPQDNPDFDASSFGEGWQMLMQKYLREYLQGL